VPGEGRPHRGRRDGDANVSQFADDPPVAPRRVLACEPEISACTRRSSGGRPGRLCEYVQRRLDSWRAGAKASPDAPTSSTKRSAAAPGRAPPEALDRRVESTRAAAAGARSPAHAGARGSRVPSSAPLCTAARPTEAAGRVADGRTTSPCATSDVGKGEAIDLGRTPLSEHEPSF
jgi:hypothetical protein